MTESKSAPRRSRPAAPKPAAEVEQAAPAETQKAECNLPGCDATPEWRGLCSAHRQTHRGLADPVVRYRPEPLHTRERKDREETR